MDDEIPTEATPYPGIDDGLLEPNNNKPDVHEGNSGETIARATYKNMFRASFVGCGVRPRYAIF